MVDLSCCGTDCNACDCYGNLCAGCNECEGKVFHVPEGKACAIYECSANGKHKKNCGECDKVPCDVWMNTRDPNYTDEEFETNVKMRIQALTEH